MSPPSQQGFRRKLNKLDAEAIFSGGKPESVMVVSGIKKQATAKPYKLWQGNIGKGHARLKGHSSPIKGQGINHKADCD